MWKIKNVKNYATETFVSQWEVNRENKRRGYRSHFFQNEITHYLVSKTLCKVLCKLGKPWEAQKLFELSQPPRFQENDL